MVTLRTKTMLALALFAAACGSSSGAPGTPANPVPTLTFGSSTPILPPAGVNVSDTQMVSATSGWALTASGLFWSNDAGASWSSITPSNVTARDIAGVYFRDASEGWLVSEHVTNPGSATAPPTTAIRAFRTNDSGRNWNSVPVPADSPSYSYGRAYLDFLDDRSGWLQLDVGSHAGFGHSEFFHTADGGMTWAKLAETVVEPGPLHFLNRSDGWVAGGDFVFVT